MCLKISLRRLLITTTTAQKLTTASIVLRQHLKVFFSWRIAFMFMTSVRPSDSLSLSLASQER